MNNNELMQKAYSARKGIINAVHSASSGHPGGSMSIIDILTFLYFEEMNIDVNDMKNPDRDRFVLSKGHASPALYSVFAEKGIIDKKELVNFRKFGSKLQGHPCMDKIDGVDISTGSLGQGISAANGMAISAKIFNKSYRVYVALGDGEIQEGEVWEAAMFAAQYKLDNLCAVVDNNNLQIDGCISDVMSPYPIDEKFAAFGWNVIHIDGHDFDSIRDGYKRAKECKGKPTVLIAKTVKGKGVSFMENQASWHGVAPNDEQAEIALRELSEKLDELGGNE